MDIYSTNRELSKGVTRTIHEDVGPIIAHFIIISLQALPFSL